MLILVMDEKHYFKLTEKYVNTFLWLELTNSPCSNILRIILDLGNTTGMPFEEAMGRANSLKNNLPKRVRILKDISEEALEKLLYLRELID